MDCEWVAKETYHPLHSEDWLSLRVSLHLPYLQPRGLLAHLEPHWRFKLSKRSLSKKSPEIDHTSFLKVTPPVVMIFLHLVHLVANFSSKQPTQYTSVSLGIMKGFDPTWVLHTTHWKHLSCHFRVLYSIFFIPIFNKDKIVNWPFRMIRMILLGKFRLIRKSCSTWKSLIVHTKSKHAVCCILFLQRGI